MFGYNYNYIYTTLHCPTLHYTTTTTTATAKTAATLPLHDTTLHCATLVTLQYTRLHYTALHYATLITLHCTTTTQHITTLQLQLHYTTATTTVTTLHYTALRCTTLHPAVVGEVTTATTPKSTTPTTFPCISSLCHDFIATSHISYSFLSLKLPPPPCAVLLVCRRSGKLILAAVLWCEIRVLVLTQHQLIQFLQKMLRPHFSTRFFHHRWAYPAS